MGWKNKSTELFFRPECCLWSVSSAWKLEFLCLTYFCQIFFIPRCRKDNCLIYLKCLFLIGSKPMLNQWLQAGILFCSLFFFFFYSEINILLTRVAEEVANMWNSVSNSHSEVTPRMINNHLPSCLTMQFKFMVKMCWYYTF